MPKAKKEVEKEPIITDEKESEFEKVFVKDKKHGSVIHGTSCIYFKDGSATVHKNIAKQLRSDGLIK
jgi:hypothetical protein